MTKQKKEIKAKENKLKGVILLLIIGVLVGLLGGIPIGMILQQMLLIDGAIGIGESLEGTTFNVEVDINETQMVDRITKNFLPLLNNTLNQNKTIR